MEAQQFVYWLQGFAELQKPDTLPTQEQWDAIREHLSTVFHKITPPVFMNDLYNKVQQQTLQNPLQGNHLVVQC